MQLCLREKLKFTASQTSGLFKRKTLRLTIYICKVKLSLKINELELISINNAFSMAVPIKALNYKPLVLPIEVLHCKLLLPMYISLILSLRENFGIFNASR